MAELFPKTPHAAIICGMPESGKAKFIMDLLEGPYRGVFRHVIFLCSGVSDNKTYQARLWVWADPEVYIVDPGVQLHEWIGTFFDLYRGKPVLYVVDDMAASKDLSKRKTNLSVLATRGRHRLHSLWVSTQHYTSVALEARWQTKWTALFFCKDRDSFDAVCREND